MIEVPKVVLFASMSAAAATTAAITESRPNPWTPELVVALFAGLTGLIGAVTTLVVSLLRSRAELAAGLAKTQTQVEEVHSYVDGDRTKLLEENARLTARVATLTDNPVDRGAAEHAEDTAADKREVVADVEAKAAAATPTLAEPPKDAK